MYNNKYKVYDKLDIINIRFTNNSKIHLSYLLLKQVIWGHMMRMESNPPSKDHHKRVSLSGQGLVRLIHQSVIGDVRERDRKWVNWSCMPACKDRLSVLELFSWVLRKTGKPRSAHVTSFDPTSTFPCLLTHPVAVRVLHPSRSASPRGAASGDDDASRVDIKDSGRLRH